jgi:transposase
LIPGDIRHEAKGGPVSDSEPWCEIIEAKVQQGLVAQRIWQDLVDDENFTSGYDSVKRFVRKLKASQPLPFRRMESSPGQESQVDFGTGAPIVGADGRRRKTHVFRLVLSHSRKGYSEVVFRQTTDDFLLCLENAFWHMGGVSRTIVIDNLKAAVKHPDWYDPELNPKVQSFCQHYGTVILPTKPYTPRHKGKVERGVAYVQENGLKGRTFTSLANENRHLEQWEATVADTRIHDTTRRQVGRMFQEVEKPALLPLPAGRFPFFQEGQRRVHRDGHVALERAFYSVPPEYLGRTVWVRWDGRLVRIFNRHMEQIAVHVQHQPGQFSTQNQHIDPKKTSAVERGVDWLKARVSLIGPQTERWAEAMLEDRGVAGVRVLVGLRSLAGQYGSDRVEQACQIALTHGAFHLRTIRELIKRGGDRQTEFEFLQEHEIIRDLSDYGELVRASQGEQPAMDPSLE